MQSNDVVKFRDVEQKYFHQALVFFISKFFVILQVVFLSLVTGITMNIMIIRPSPS